MFSHVQPYKYVIAQESVAQAVTSACCASKDTACQLFRVGPGYMILPYANGVLVLNLVMSRSHLYRRQLPA